MIALQEFFVKKQLRIVKIISRKCVFGRYLQFYPLVQKFLMQVNFTLRYQKGLANKRVRVRVYLEKKIFVL